MKICVKCLTKYDADYDYCPKCGSNLKPIPSGISKYSVIALLCAVLVIIVIVGMFKETSAIQKQQDEIIQGRYERALEEQRNTPSTSDLTINQDWSHRRDGKYIYITGTVSNNSTKDINYYEIGVRFFDASGNVVDTDYTNGLDLEAGDSRQFEIMHKANVNYSQISLYVKDVN